MSTGIAAPRRERASGDTPGDTAGDAPAGAEPRPPEEERRMPAVVRLLLRWSIGLGFLIAITRLIGEFGNGVIVVVLVTVLIAVGLHLLVHWSGQLSLGHAAFVGLGGFTTMQTNAVWGVPLELAVLFGGVAAAVGSMAVGLPALKIRGFALAITTLAFGFAAHEWLFEQDWLSGGSIGVQMTGETFMGFDAQSSRQLVIPLIVLVGVLVALTSSIGASGIGRSLRMVAADQEVAATHGVHVGSLKFGAFVYSATLAGLAGGLWAVSLGRLSPTTLDPTLSILYVSPVLLGGPGPVTGTAMAATGLAWFPFIAGGIGTYAPLIGSAALVLAVTTVPKGVNELNRRNRLALEHAVVKLRSSLERIRSSNHGSGDSSSSTSSTKRGDRKVHR